MIKKALIVGAAIMAAAVAVTLFLANQASAYDADLRATLRDPRGRLVGTVEFRVRRDVMHVDARLWPNEYVKPDQFHGFHVHANNDPTNRDGCYAVASSPSSTWFQSADSHLSEATGTPPVPQNHGAHNGDFPSPLVMADGTARLRFSTDRIDPEVLRRTAVILHDKPDNFNNIPVGPSPNHYTANGSPASDLTNRTGNAGDRMACGVVRRYR